MSTLSGVNKRAEPKVVAMVAGGRIRESNGPLHRVATVCISDDYH